MENINDRFGNWKRYYWGVETKNGFENIEVWESVKSGKQLVYLKEIQNAFGLFQSFVSNGFKYCKKFPNLVCAKETNQNNKMVLLEDVEAFLAKIGLVKKDNGGTFFILKHKRGFFRICQTSSFKKSITDYTRLYPETFELIETVNVTDKTKASFIIRQTLQPWATHDYKGTEYKEECLNVAIEVLKILADK